MKSFEDKKREIRQDSVPFLLAIPAMWWIKTSYDADVPLWELCLVPIAGYIIFAMLEIIGYHIWKS